MPNRRRENDYPADVGEIEYIDEPRARDFMDEPILLSDEDDKREHRLQLARDKDHPAHGLDSVVDNED